MRKKVQIIKEIVLISIIVLLFLMLGSEPTTFTEENLENYYTMWDKGNVGWYMIRVWGVLIFTFVVISMVEHYTLKKVMKN